VAYAPVTEVMLDEHHSKYTGAIFRVLYGIAMSMNKKRNIVTNRGAQNFVDYLRHHMRKPGQKA